MLFFSTQPETIPFNYFTTFSSSYVPPSFGNHLPYYQFVSMTPAFHSIPFETFHEATSFQIATNSSHSSSDLYQQPTNSPQRSQNIQRQVRKQKMNGKGKQKFGRNITSNIFHMMINFIKRNKNLRKKVGIIIKKYSMTSINGKQFFNILKQKSIELESYITSQKMRQFWRGDEVQSAEKDEKMAQFNKIFRIIGKHYLQNYHFAYAYNCNKLKRESKAMHCSAIRKITSL